MAFFEEAVDTLEIRKYSLQAITLTRVNKKEFYFTVAVKDRPIFLLCTQIMKLPDFKASTFHVSNL